MGRVRSSKDGYLFLDFYYKGVRCREYTVLEDSAKNRTLLEKTMATIEKEITRGSFNYLKYFPEGSRADLFGKAPSPLPKTNGQHSFEEFAWKWYKASKVEWKRSTARDFLSIMETHLIPYFKDVDIRTPITKFTLKEFRTGLSLKEGKKGKKMSNKRINNIMAVLRLILSEAAEEFKLPSPFEKLTPLSIEKEEIDPFSLDEMDIFLAGVRADFVNYYTVRFLTAMRTAEIDGLKWEYVDFEAKKIRVRETWQRNQWDTPKTKSSVRDIDMSERVEKALRAQKEVTGHLEIVFANRAGNPLDHNLVTKRIWYPTLKRLNLKQRKPYQTRHTTATLWLASGENPEWVARQMGHSSTAMLFRTYSRFIPNLTRKDGSAFESFLKDRTKINEKKKKEDDNEDNDRRTQTRPAVQDFPGHQQGVPEKIQEQ